MDWECIIILYMFKVRNYIPGRWSWKSNVVLEKSFKNGCSFLYEPCYICMPFCETKTSLKRPPTSICKAVELFSAVFK